MQQILSWRDLLETIISDPTERDRIATELGVRTITLTRWVHDNTTPRSDNLQRLLRVLPEQYQEQFLELLRKDFPTLPLNKEADISDELLIELVNEVLLTRAMGPDMHRFWAISRQVLQHAILQLDPQVVGMTISVVQCMPPSDDGKIRSLRERVGLGTLPWASDVEPKALFLGAESFAGYVTAVGHFEQINDLRIEKAFLPAIRTEYEVSTAAHPIMLASRVAGCLLLSCTQPGYFVSQARRLLIQRYANLVALAFETHEFYPIGLLELRTVPAPEAQQPYFAKFHQRVSALMRASAQTPHPLNVLEAEQAVWRQLEEILLHLPLQDTTNT